MELHALFLQYILHITDIYVLTYMSYLPYNIGGFQVSGHDRGRWLDEELGIHY